MSKKNLKQFQIKDAEDILLVLGDLIMNIIYDLDKYEQYHSEVLETIINYAVYDEKKNKIIYFKSIPAEVYESLSDKILYRQFLLLKNIADEQCSSFSYKSIRKVAKKLKYINFDLPENISLTLNELHQIRNWSFHNTQSDYVAAFEVVKKTISHQLDPDIKFSSQLNPVNRRAYKFYDITYFYSLEVHLRYRSKQFYDILANMKKDYEEIYMSLLSNSNNQSKVQDTRVDFIINKIDIPRKPLDDFSDMTQQLSMAMQKGKYTESEKSFKEWTMKTNKDE